MTFPERMAALRDSWALLPSGGLLGVIDTPNRLWLYDDHTALLPFFHWLPNEVAFAYSKFSARDNFRELYRDYTPDQKLHFLRRGRGVSFHEFELAITARQQLDIAGNLASFHRDHSPEERQAWEESSEAAFAAVLGQTCPDLHEAFREPYLNLVLRKR